MCKYILKIQTLLGKQYGISAMNVAPCVITLTLLLKQINPFKPQVVPL